MSIISSILDAIAIATYILNANNHCYRLLLPLPPTTTTSVAIAIAIVRTNGSLSRFTHPTPMHARAAMTKYPRGMRVEPVRAKSKLLELVSSTYVHSSHKEEPISFNAPAKNHGLFGELSHEFHVLSIANLAQPALHDDVVVVLVLCAALMSLLGAGSAHACRDDKVRRRRWVVGWYLP